MFYIYRIDLNQLCNYMSINGIPTISYFITQSQFFDSFISPTPTSFYRIREGNDPGVLEARHHYHIHGWWLDDCMRPYIVNATLHGVFCLGKVNRSRPGRAIFLGDSHFRPSSRRDSRYTRMLLFFWACGINGRAVVKHPKHD